MNGKRYTKINANANCTAVYEEGPWVSLHRPVRLPLVTLHWEHRGRLGLGSCWFTAGPLSGDGPWTTEVTDAGETMRLPGAACSLELTQKAGPRWGPCVRLPGTGLRLNGG